jgi:hypothetical protein
MPSVYIDDTRIGSFDQNNIADVLIRLSSLSEEQKNALLFEMISFLIYASDLNENPEAEEILGIVFNDSEELTEDNWRGDLDDENEDADSLEDDWYEPHICGDGSSDRCLSCSDGNTDANTVQVE